MTKLEVHLNTLATGVEGFTKLGLEAPSRDDDNWKEYEKKQKEHTAKMEAFFEKNAQPMAMAAFFVLASFFQNIERIAEAQDPGNGR
jgi:hypothetical protein